MNRPATNQLAGGDALSRAASLYQKTHWQTKLGGLLILVLLAAPRTRTVIGAPLYLIDVLAFIILIMPLSGRRFSWVPRTPFSQIIYVYFACVVISELRGMFAYGTLIESVYMTGRFVIGISLFYTLPKLISSDTDLSFILKGVLVGILASATMVIMYSLGPIRPLIVNTLYSSEILNPGWEQLVRAVQIYGAGESAMRGRSLVGAATLTAGFIASVWPLSFLAYRHFKDKFVWNRIALAAMIIAPIGVLMTYGRGAWVMVASIVILISLFGMASARKTLLIVVIGGVILFNQLEVDSDLFYLDRLVQSSQTTIDDPLSDVSTTERLFSYSEPFEHLADNPIWLVAGAGRTGSKSAGASLGGQLYDEGGRATHSAFAMAYYSFGFVAATCQVLLIVQGFRFIYKRMRYFRRTSGDQLLVWQSLFMCLTTFTLWWGSGHGMVGEPRGAMLMFVLYGLLVSFEKLRIMQQYEQRTNKGDTEKQ